MKNKQLDITKIIDNLYIAAWPKDIHKEDLEAIGTKLIISMILQSPDKELAKPPFRLLKLRTIDSPLTPMPMKKLVRGVKEALPVINNNETVVIYCKQGVHRSVAMTCCILIGLGYSAKEAMDLVKSKREKADPYKYYIRWRIEKFEKIWNEKNSCHPKPVEG